MNIIGTARPVLCKVADGEPTGMAAECFFVVPHVVRLRYLYHFSLLGHADAVTTLQILAWLCSLENDRVVTLDRNQAASSALLISLMARGIMHRLLRSDQPGVQESCIRALVAA